MAWSIACQLFDLRGKPLSGVRPITVCVAWESFNYHVPVFNHNRDTAPLSNP
jgi:hypothetical protein